MKQIGARQEAGRIGGTGPCGRELCCATWMKNFVSVSTNAARIQDISLNPQKLAGMCAKLKCCLNYEVDDYVEAGRKMPSRDVVLQTLDNDYYLFKSDILAGLVTYSTGKGVAANLETITAERARAIIEMNKRGEKPESLTEDGKAKEQARPADLLADADISRFDKAKKAKKKKKKQQQPKDNAAQQGNAPKNNAAQQGNAPKDNNATAQQRDGEGKERGPKKQQRRDNRQQRQPNNNPKPQGQPNGNQKPQVQPNNNPKPQVQPNNTPKPQGQPNGNPKPQGQKSEEQNKPQPSAETKQ